MTRTLAILLLAACVQPPVEVPDAGVERMHPCTVVPSSQVPSPVIQLSCALSEDDGGTLCSTLGAVTCRTSNDRFVRLSECDGRAWRGGFGLVCNIVDGGAAVVDVTFEDEGSTCASATEGICSRDRECVLGEVELSSCH